MFKLPPVEPIYVEPHFEDDFAERRDEIHEQEANECIAMKEREQLEFAQRVKAGILAHREKLAQLALETMESTS